MELLSEDVAAAVARAGSRRASSAVVEADVDEVAVVGAELLQRLPPIDTSWPLLCILALQFLDTEWRVKYFLGTLYSDVSGLDNLKRNWETWRRHCDRWNVANRDHDHVC